MAPWSHWQLVWFKVNSLLCGMYKMLKKYLEIIQIKPMREFSSGISRYQILCFNLGRGFNQAPKQVVMTGSDHNMANH